MLQHHMDCDTTGRGVVLARREKENKRESENERRVFVVPPPNICVTITLESEGLLHGVLHLNSLLFVRQDGEIKQKLSLLQQPLKNLDVEKTSDIIFVLLLNIPSMLSKGIDLKSESSC